MNDNPILSQQAPINQSSPLPEGEGKGVKATPQSLGGQTVLAKHGREHFVALGKAGFQATVDKHFHGDRAAACTWLAKKGLASLDATYQRWGFNYFEDPGPHPAHLRRGPDDGGH